MSVTTDSASGPDELAELRDLHRDYFVSVARSLDAKGAQEALGDDEERLATFDAEAANMRAALEWSADRGHAKIRPLVLALKEWLLDRRYYREARHAIDRALAIEGTEAETVGLLRFAAEVSDDAAKAEAHRRQAVDLARGLEDPAVLLGALRSWGWGLFVDGRIQAAAAVFEEAIEVGRRSDAVSERADVLRGLGWAVLRLGDGSRALSLHEEASALVRDKGTLRNLLGHLGVHVNLLVQLQDPTGAEVLSDEAVETARGIGDPSALGSALTSRGWLLQNSGDSRSAVRYFREALDVLSDRDSERRVSCLKGLAEALLDGGDIDEVHAVINEGVSFLSALVEPNSSDRWALSEFHGLRSELAEARGELDAARRSLDAYLENLRHAKSTEAVWHALRATAFFHLRHGDVDTAARRLSEAVDFVPDDDPSHVATRHLDAATLAAARGDLVEAARRANQAAAVGAPQRQVEAYLSVSRYALALGDMTKAATALSQAEDIATRVWELSSVGRSRANYAAATGDGTRARSLLREGYRARSTARDFWHAGTLEVLAEAAAREDRTIRAVELLAAATAERERLRMPRLGVAAAAERRILDAIGDTVSVEEQRAAEARGRALDPLMTVEAELRE